VEHLIFAFHAQALAFLCYLVIGSASLAASLAGWDIGAAAGSLLLITTFVLIFLSFRRVYGQGFLMTLFKVLFVGAAYGSIVIVAFALMALGLGTMIMGSA
jgi:hypothetical protein